MRTVAAGLVRKPLPVILFLIGVAALGCLIWFDLGPALAFNDDFLFAWSVRQLAAGHGLRVLPEQSPLALVQVAWGALLSLGRADPRVLRLSAVPFVLASAAGVYYLSRRFSADRFWAALGSLALVLAPFFLSVATSFMTDAFYAGLLVLAAVAGILWIEEGKMRWTCCLLVLLAGLERQNGIAMVAALSVGLLLSRSRRRVTRAEWLTLVCLWLACGLVLLAPPLLGLHTGAHRMAGLLTANPLRLLKAASYFGPALGLVIAPFLVAAIFTVRLRPVRGWSALLPVVLAEIGVLNLGIAALSGAHLIGISFWNQGNYFSVAGLNPLHLSGDKPALYPLWLFVLVQLMALAAFTVILIGHRGEWMAQRLGRSGVFLVVLAATQLLVMAQGDVYDRYFIPVVAPLIPIVAALASRTARPKLAAAWACAVLALWLGLYFVGEQDYQRWEAARDQAARMAYMQALPSQVDAGYEANAIYWEIPLYELTNAPVGRQPADVYGEPSVVGPPAPLFRLVFARPDDPRPGVVYSSLAPGKVVIVPVVSPSPPETAGR